MPVKPTRSLNLFILLIFTTVAVATLGGCEHLGYYSQAVGGHMSIMLKRRSIDEVIAAPKTEAELKARLRKIIELRAFAENELQLPVSKQYSTYVDLNRPAAVWNVFAAPPYSLASKQWCYLIIGCASYRGYYHEDDALEYAHKLAQQGYDTYVGSSAAYSTLGWFNDPVLNTFVNLSDSALANLIFHELAHQVLYLNGDTVFNESFATVVAQEGVRRWLEHNSDNSIWQRYLARQQLQNEFLNLVEEYRTKLQELYESDRPQAEIIAQKANTIDALRQAHLELKTKWGGQSPYDAWFNEEINNAKLNTVATYYDLVPAFSRLLAWQDNNLAEFYLHCAELGQLSKPDRHARLNALPGNEE